MLAKLCDWLDDRTGYRKLVGLLLIEHIPGGAKWRYVWGSVLAFVFTLQLVTGVLLMTAYSPGDSTAWGSVWYIQYQMDFGWFIRGLHHFGSQAMVVLLAVHMLQVVIAGAHLPPREVNWWLGLALMGAVLALSLTGYLLPWDQKGYWATQVATNIAGSLPGLGSFARQVIVGGPEYGHATLTRFYALHVGILPPLVIALVIAHVAVFRRHGVTAPKHAQGEGWFWPDQAFRDLVACLLIFAVLVGLVLWGHGHKTDPAADKLTWDYWAHAGRDGKGANLDAPADPARPYPARPEWYFLFLFQLLKYFEGSQEIIGTVVIPNGVALLLFLLPLLAFGRKEGGLRVFAHAFGVLVVVALLTGAAGLTLLALAEDVVFRLSHGLLTQLATKGIPLIALVLLFVLAVLALLRPGPFRSFVGVLGAVVLVALGLAAAGLTYLALDADRKYVEHKEAGHAEPYAENRLPPQVREWVEAQMTAEEKKPSKKAEKFCEELLQADKAGARAVTLAGDGIPAEGAVLLLRRDPMTEGKLLFGAKCAACHTHGDDFKVEKPTASDLKGWGTERWVAGLLSDPEHGKYFGHTKLDRMSRWVGGEREKAKNKDDRARARGELDGKGEEAKLNEDFEVIARWLGGHPRADAPADSDQSDFAKGFRAFEGRCVRCHTYKDYSGAVSEGPDLTGYGDARWLRLMLTAPDHRQRYGMKNVMPAFRDWDNPAAAQTKEEYVAEVLKDVKKEQDKKELGQFKFTNLSDVERELIIRFLTNDDRAVFGGQAISGPPKRQRRRKPGPRAGSPAPAGPC